MLDKPEVLELPNDLGSYLGSSTQSSNNMSMVSMMNQSVKEVSTFSFSWSSEALHFYVLHLRAIFQTKIKHFQIKHLRLNWLRCSHLTNKK